MNSIGRKGTDQERWINQKYEVDNIIGAVFDNSDDVEEH